MSDEQTIICRCEEVTLREIVDTIQTQKCSPRELKLRTRAGMGYCGGRTCRVLIDSVVQNLTHQSPNDVSLKHQPPVRPIPFHIEGEVDK